MNIFSYHPKTFGLFHLLLVSLTILLSILISYTLGRRHSEKIEKKVLLVFSVLLIGLEIWKQIYIPIYAGGYNFSLIPFQFCSIDLYALPLALILKGKAKEACYSFLAFFGMVGGICVLSYPNGIFSYNPTALMLHSCLYHMAMVVLSSFLLVSRNYGKSYKEVIGGSIIFFTTFIIAVTINETLYFVKDSFGGGLHLFDMSSRQGKILPIFDSIPFPVFCILYSCAIILVVTIIWFITRCVKGNKNIKKRRTYVENTI